MDEYDLSESWEQSHPTCPQTGQGPWVRCSVPESLMMVDDESSLTTVMTAWRLYSGESPSELSVSDCHRACDDGKPSLAP